MCPVDLHDVQLFFQKGIDGNHSICGLLSHLLMSSVTTGNFIRPKTDSAQGSEQEVLLGYGSTGL